MTDVVADARSPCAFAADAAQAPTRPGVYFFLDCDRTLLYVGKAANLRRRLGDHVRDACSDSGSRLHRAYRHVHEVRWEETADDDAALVREADLIVALRPRLNAALTGGAHWTYLVVRRPGSTAEPVAFELSREPVRADRVFGCFPHLGPGQCSRPGIACTDGLTSLLRLLWAVNQPSPGRPFPRRISGTTAPPAVEIPVAAVWDVPLHRLLSGRSSRLVDDLAAAIETDAVAEYMRPALRRDVLGAAAFYRYGPEALRRLRLRHGRPAGPLPQSAIERLLADEVRDSIGEFRLHG